MTVVEARVPTRAPGLELLGAQQDSGYQDAPCMVRRADGQTVQVTPLLYQLLEAIDDGRDLDQLADVLGDRTGKSVTAENVRVLIEDKLEPMGLVCGPDGAPPAERTPAPLLALRWKFVISDPAITRRITAPFAALFHKAIVVPVLLAFAVTCFWVLFRHGLASGTRQAFDSPELLLAVFGLTVISAGWHEFGHAAACRSAGATPGAMGAGVYLVWPAFYTDVDDAYRLDRWGRLKVDLGGLYFNAIAAVAVMGAWLAFRVDALLLVVATQLIQMLRQLAPMIRADGYHILSDLVGVPDLFHHIKPTLAGLLPTTWGKPQPLRRGPRWVVRGWVLLIVPLLLWMMIGTVLLLPRLVATAWLGLQQQVTAFRGGFVDGDVLAVFAAILKMFSLALPVAAGVYLVSRVVRKTFRQVWTRTEEHPGARAAFMLLVGLLVFALALAWWPSGQYEPVAASERGTLQQAFQLSSSRRPVADDTTTASRFTAPPRPAGFEPIAGVEPQTGYALVPRDPDQPSLLLVRDDDGELRSIVTDGDATTGQTQGLAFPFELPEAPGKGDNQALAVNTGDGTAVYDVSIALVWVKDGEVADNRNEAYALASCTNCTTVAVAFQVVLIVGQSDAVTPLNVAVAANGGCLSCQTTALALQLVITLNDVPSEEVQRELENLMGRLDDAGSLQELYDEMQAVQREIVTLLYEEGLIDENNEPTTATATDDGETSTTTTSTTISGASGSTSDEDDGTTTPTTARSSSSSTTSTTTRSTTSTSTPASTTTTTDAPTTTTTDAPTSSTTAP